MAEVLIQVFLCLLAGLGLWRSCRVFMREERLVRKLVLAGFAARAILGAVLFVIAWWKLPIARSLHHEHGLWFFAPDGRRYFLAAAEAAERGPWAILTYPRTGISVTWVQSLSVFEYLFGRIASVGVLLNLFCYLGMCLIILKWLKSSPESRLPGLVALAAVALSPSAVLWSVAPLKDTLFQFLIVCSVGAGAVWQRAWRDRPAPIAILTSAAVLVMALFGLTGMRWYFGFVLLGASALFFTLTTAGARRKAIAAVTSLVLLFLMSQAFLLSGETYVPDYVRYALAPWSVRAKPPNTLSVSQMTSDMRSARTGFENAGGATSIGISGPLARIDNGRTIVPAAAPVTEEDWARVAAPAATPAEPPSPPPVAESTGAPAAVEVAGVPEAAFATTAPEPAIVASLQMPEEVATTSAAEPPPAAPTETIAEPPATIAAPTATIAETPATTAEPPATIVEPAPAIAAPTSTVAPPSMETNPVTANVAETATTASPPPAETDATPKRAPRIANRRTRTVRSALQTPPPVAAKPAQPAPVVQTTVAPPPVKPPPRVVAAAAAATEEAIVVPESTLVRLAAGGIAVLVPSFVTRKLGILKMGGGRGMWWFTDLDTIMFDLVLLAAIGFTVWRLRWATLRNPTFWFVLFVATIGLPLIYTVTNFGTLFRLRMMMYITVALIPLALSMAAAPRPDHAGDRTQ